MAYREVLLTPEMLQKIAAMHKGEVALPAYITKWKQAIELRIATLEAHASANTLDDRYIAKYMEGLVKMKVRTDSLYNKWLHDIPHKTWDELAQERPPSAEDIYAYTVEDTEDCLNGGGVSTFVLYLNERWNGLLKDFAHACLRECDPLLEEGVTLTPDLRHIFAHPEIHFDTKNKDVLWTKLHDWAETQFAPDQARHVKTLLIANILVGVGDFSDYLAALSLMEFARCEAADPMFETHMKSKDPRSTTALLQAQRWQIDVLLKLWPAT